MIVGCLNMFPFENGKVTFDMFSLRVSIWVCRVLLASGVLKGGVCCIRQMSEPAHVPCRD